MAKPIQHCKVKKNKNKIQFLAGKKKLYRQAKAERIQHHQTSSSTNAKGSSLDRKQKMFIFSNPKQHSKWQQDHTYQ